MAEKAPMTGFAFAEQSRILFSGRFEFLRMVSEVTVRMQNNKQLVASVEDLKNYIASLQQFF